MKLKKKLKTTLLILLLLGSNPTFAGETGKAKRLFTGDRAPYDGLLLDDVAMRDVDILTYEKEACEIQLHECGVPTPSLNDWGWQGVIIGFLVGGFVTYTLSH